MFPRLKRLVKIFELNCKGVTFTQTFFYSGLNHTNILTLNPFWHTGLTKLTHLPSYPSKRVMVRHIQVNKKIISLPKTCVTVEDCSFTCSIYEWEPRFLRRLTAQSRHLGAKDLCHGWCCFLSIRRRLRCWDEHFWQAFFSIWLALRCERARPNDQSLQKT